MRSFFSRLVTCGSKKRSKSAYPVHASRTVVSLHSCETCLQSFPNKNALTVHHKSCAPGSSSTNQSKDLVSNKNSSQGINSPSRVETITPKDVRIGSNHSSRKDVTDKNNQLDKTGLDHNKTVTPDKSLSDTFTTDRGYRNMDTLSDKTSTSTYYPFETEVNRFLAELDKKGPKERREAELNFITKNIDKKTHTRFLVSEAWIEYYTSYLNGEQKKPPEPINNENLKQMILTKTLPKNIYLINELVWRFVQKCYGGGPEIKQSNKSISFLGQSVSDHLSETQTADTFSRSEGLESMRNSVLETQTTPWYINTTPYLKPMGFANPSFYCYMNACLQMLLGITEFSQYIYQEKYKNLSGKEDTKFWKSMTEVVHGHFKNQSCMIPKNLRRLSVKCFDPYQQHDAHEFLTFLLSGLQDELNLSLPKKEIEFKTAESAWIHYRKYHVSLVDELLSGQLISTVRCTACKHVSKTFDPFLDLSLPIIPGETKDLSDCLQAFEREEDIDDNYKCEKCKATGKAKKKLHAHRYPKYLLVNLKRFQTLPKKKKIRDMISYPVTSWKLKDEATKETFTYSLTGAIVHYGPIDSGHYVCYSKRGDNWILCDDENVGKVDEKEVASKEAYILMYEKSSPLGVAKL